MNEAHLHLLLNHTPILGCLFGLVVLGWGLWKANPTVIRTGLVALLVAAGLCLPTQLTGEGAEEVLKQLPGFSRERVQAHEEAAELGFWMLELTGAGALLALLMRQRQRLLASLTLAGAVVSFLLLARAGNLGGQISHPEARPAFVAPAGAR
jgi:hypothetical protein